MDHKECLGTSPLGNLLTYGPKSRLIVKQFLRTVFEC